MEAAGRSDGDLNFLEGFKYRDVVFANYKV